MGEIVQQPLTIAVGELFRPRSGSPLLPFTVQIKKKILLFFQNQIKLNIMKICPCNKQRFLLVVKNENFIRKILIFFFIFAQNIDCGYTLEPPRPLEPPRRGGSNEYPQSMF